jgi:hypothetical protein
MVKSPFPGMDPYLETDWLDVHSRLVTYSCDQLQDRLPRDLVARMESRILLEDKGEGERRGRHPDVRVIERDSGGTGGAATAVLAEPQVALAEPDVVVVDASAEPAMERYIEVVDFATRNRVITTIEFLSPTNKRPGIGMEMYLEKREECLAGGVSFVEIDLTRGGDRLAVLPFLGRLAWLPFYVACVRRGSKPRLVEVYSLPLDRPLRPIRIPLRPTDPDVVLELQPLVEQAYDRGRYDGLDYSQTLQPPLLAQEAAWIDERLRAATKS